MANLDQTEALNLLRVSLGSAAFPTVTTPVKLRLMTNVPTATTNGTEVANSGGSAYTVGGIAIPLPSPITASPVASNGAINYTNMPSVPSPGVQAVEVWDSSTTPVRKWFGGITAKVTNLGDTLSFASGGVTIGLS